MASFTIEDIEFIRRKSGITYEEAIALLDYHNGDVMRALVDLERNGRIRQEAGDERSEPDREDTGSRPRKAGFLQTRFMVIGNGKPVINLPILFVIIALFVSPWLVLGAAIVCILVGYRISISALSDESNERIERMVKSAADNVKRTATNFARGVGEAVEHHQEAARKAKAAEEQRKQEPPKDEVWEPWPEEAADPDPLEDIVSDMERRAAGVPTIQVPVKVESTDGSMVVGTDEEGYATATIE